MLVNGHDGHRSFGHDIASTTALGRRLAEAGITLPVGNPSDWPWADWEEHISPPGSRRRAALSPLIIVNTGAVLEIDHAIIDSTAPKPIIDRLVAATERALAELVASASGARASSPARSALGPRRSAPPS